MNKVLLVTLLGLLASAAGVLYYLHSSSEEATIKATWEQWKSTQNKFYTSNEEPLRYQIFKTNYYKVQAQNKRFELGQSKFTMGLNQFADLTKAEFKAILGTKPQKPEFPVEELPTDSLQASVDWRTKNAVTPVKNQGGCGSCWAFSTTGSLEGLHAIKTGTLTSFSEQELVDCSGSYGNQGCNGGLMDNAFQYVIAKGIETEKDYPYTGQDGTCRASTSKATWKIKGFKDVQSNSAAQLKAALALGPVSVAIEADQDCFQLYSSGILDDASCGTSLDHGVLAVGYGSQGGKNYWIVKNSWGASWGEQGYIRIADDSSQSAGICGILSEPSYPTA